MKHVQLVCLMICVLTISMISHDAAAAQKVLVVSGASEERVQKSQDYKRLFDGISNAFKETPAIKVETLWSNISDLSEPAALETESQAVLKQIKAAKPDLVLVVGDACLRHVGQKIDDIPVVFAWLFTSIETYEALPKKNITGVIQKFYTLDAWSMAASMFGAKTVSMVSYENTFMKDIETQLLDNAAPIEEYTGVLFKKMYLHKTFPEWQTTCRAFGDDILHLGDTGRIKKAGKEITAEELVSWTVANMKKPVLGSSENHVAAGALFAIVTSDLMTGYNAGKAAQKILIEKKVPGDIEYITNEKGRLVINATTAQKLGIEIPYDVLSSADKIYE